MTGQIALLATILHDKKKSGGSLPDSCRDSYAVDVLCAVVDLLQQLRGVQASRNRCWATSNIFQMTAVAFSTFLNRFAASVRSLRAAKGDSIGLLVRRWTQCALENW